MTNNKADDLEKIDIKTTSKFMIWMKRVAYITTIFTTLSGGVLGIVSFVREVKDPRAQAGYDNHSKMLIENSRNIRENRNEIRFIYRTLVSKDKFEKPSAPPKVKDRFKQLPDTPIQKPLDWKKLHLRRKE